MKLPEITKIRHDMVRSVLSRDYQDKATYDSWNVFDGDRLVKELKAIELPDKGNQHNISCILEGWYWIVKEMSPTRGKTFRVLNVKDRTGVLCHIGNFATGVKVDTLGCILPGMYFADINKDGFMDVAESTKAMDILWDLLPDKSKLYIL